MQDLLEVLRVQRHDFLNHLQVISGLLQLKRYDGAFAYIQQVGEELGRAGSTARLGCPEIVAVILTSELAASKKGVQINVEISTDFEKGLMSAFAVAEIVRDMLNTAISLVEVSAGAKGCIDFEIMQKDGAYVFQVSFGGSRNTEILAIESSAVFLGEMAGKLKGRFNTGTSADGATVLTLAVPVPDELSVDS